MIAGDVALIGVPTNSSGTRDGVARAPDVLRESGLLPLLADTGLADTGQADRARVQDAGDLLLADPEPERGPSGLLAEDALVEMIGQVRAAVGTARRDGRFPLLLGGDCPVLLGALAALQDEQPEPGLLFVDGHEDAWPPALSPTGEAADCELGLALRVFDDELDGRLLAALPRIRPDHVVALGPRDAAELEAAGVPSLAGKLRAQIRPEHVRTQHARDAAAALPAPWWLHTDLDVLATAELAAVDYQQPGGLTWQQLSEITAAALAAPGCAGWSVCIYNPDLDPDRHGARAITGYLARAIFGAITRTE
jgi:arginase